MASPSFPRSIEAVDLASMHEVSLLALVNGLLRRIRIIVGLTMLGTAVAAGMVLTRPPLFTADSRFLPANAGTSRGGQLSGLAAQFGLELPTGDVAQSGDFYADLLQSRHLLREAVTTPFSLRAVAGSRAPRTGTLLDYWGLAPATEQNIVKGVRSLRRATTVAVTPKTQIVSLRVSLGEPGLAVAVNRRMLDLVQRFDQQQRRSQAAAEREFVQERLASAGRELRQAEAALEAFLASNRQYSGSPQLAAAYARLQRSLDLRQQVYVSLAQAFEKAKIDEVRNTPLVTVLDGPEGSALRKGQALFVTVLGGAALGLVLGTLIALVVGYIDRQRTESPGDFEEFMSRSRAAAAGLLPAIVRRRVLRGAGALTGAESPGESRAERN